MFAVLLFTLLQSAPSTIPADLAAELRVIKAEQAKTESAGKALETERAAIIKQENHIKDTEDLLDRGIKTLDVERDARDADHDALKAEIAQAKDPALALKRAVDDFNLEIQDG